MTDIDEYIDIVRQPEGNKSKISILDDYEKLDRIGAIKIKNWDFGPGPKANRRPTNLLIDHVWKSRSITMNRDKSIVRPWNVHYYSIHTIMQGKSNFVLNATTE